MERELPKGWVETDLDTVVSRMTNGSGLKQLEEPYEGSFPISRIETIWNETIDLTRVKYVSPTEDEIEKYKLLKGDVLFSHINSDKHLGKTAVFNLEDTVLHGINLLLLRTCSQYDGYFLNYLLRHYRFSGRFIEVAQRSVNQSSINQKKLKSFNAPLPPLAEQKRIVAKLDTLFASLENTKTRLEKIPTLLKNFKQAILTQAVTGKLTEQWREGKELDSNKYFEQIDLIHESKKKPVKIKGSKGFGEDLELFNIPRSWEWIPNLKLTNDGGNAICAGPFGTIFKAKDFRTEGIPIIFLRHVKPEGFNQKKPNYMDKKVWEEFHQEYSINGGELLITKLGDPPGDATIFPHDFGVAMVTPDVMKADYNEELFCTKYAKFFFNSDPCKELIAGVSFGMTRLRIDLTMFKSFLIPVPTFEEQTEIVRRVESLFAKADAIEQQYQSLKKKIDTLPQALLAKAFRGELVEQNPLDEPASVLLEKIKAEKEKLSDKPKRKITRTKK